MTGHMELERLFAAWRKDIDSVPFPVIVAPPSTRVPTQRPASGRGQGTRRARPCSAPRSNRPVQPGTR